MHALQPKAVQQERAQALSGLEGLQSLLPQPGSPKAKAPATTVRCSHLPLWSVACWAFSPRARACVW